MRILVIPYQVRIEQIVNLNKQQFAPNHPKKDPLPNLSAYRAYMHPDEVRKREREALPPLKNDNGTFRIMISGS